jgi:membrane associated rhomboid family serine protease
VAKVSRVSSGSEAALFARRAFHAARREIMRWIVSPVIVMWMLEAFDQLLPRPGLDAYGIRPRTEGGLWGILFAPFLHRGFAHLMANTVPLLLFGALVLTRGTRAFLRVSGGVILLGGLGVWLFGRPATIHLGASGLVFGYLGYLMTVGWFERHLGWIALSIGIALLYGGLLRGALPGTPGISWEGHLAGFLAGCAVARWSGGESTSRRLR